MTGSLVTGIDASRGGWVAVTLTGDGSVRVTVASTLDGLALDNIALDGVTGIDMPLGLLPAGWRTADLLARRALAPGYADIDRAIADLSRPGALTASLNWYRANLAPRMPGPRPEFPPVTAPVLGIWSDGDRYLDGHRMRASGEVVKGPWRYEEISGSSHWIPLDAPERLNELLLDWLSPLRRPRSPGRRPPGGRRRHGRSGWAAPHSRGSAGTRKSRARIRARRRRR